MVALFAEIKQPSRDEASLRKAIRAIDALVLGAYGLFAPAEQRLVSLFAGQQKPGLPFNVDAIGTESRLPQYLDIPEIMPDLPPASAAKHSLLLADIDLEIEEGRRELAALRRISGSSETRVTARIKYVRETLRVLEEHAADIGIPDHPMSP